MQGNFIFFASDLWIALSRIALDAAGPYSKDSITSLHKDGLL